MIIGNICLIKQGEKFLLDGERPTPAVICQLLARDRVWSEMHPDLGFSNIDAPNNIKGMCGTRLATIEQSAHESPVHAQV